MFLKLEKHDFPRKLSIIKEQANLWNNKILAGQIRASKVCIAAVHDSKQNRKDHIKNNYNLTKCMVGLIWGTCS